uniref:Reverse transcriptase domain-containing protein n=1 Tax=Tanacetum cinerariifolium TaxID=118510 RepID=A0A699KQK0_TANCI|nr:reverse transcriptase domain-containing protein [Tanacetum cinerariifolium]
MRAMPNRITNKKTELKNNFQIAILQQSNKLQNMLSNYFQMNKPSGSGSLPSNTVTNPKGGGKRARGGKGYDATKLNTQKLRERDDHQMMKFLQIFRSLHFNISFSDALLYMPKFASTFKNLLNNKEKLFELANTPVNENCSAVILKKLLEKLGDPELTLRVSDEAITFKVGDTLRYSYNDAELINRIDVIDIACEEYSQEVLGFSDNSRSGNLTLTSEPIIAISSPSLTPFKGIDEPPELELEDLPSHLEYAFLEGTDKLTIIIAKNLKDEEKERIIKVLKSHKQEITWKLFDIKGIDLQFCTHKILMEDDFKPAV